MDQILIEALKNSPVGAAIVVMYMMLRHFAKQKSECHEWQDEQSKRHEALTLRLENVLGETNRCLAQCAMSHQRSEKVFSRILGKTKDDPE